MTLSKRELSAFDSVSAVVGQRGVAVLVDVVRAEHRLPALDLEELVHHGLAVVALVAGVLDRLERDAHGLIAVDRVGLRVLAVLGLELREEVLRRRRVLLRIQRRVGDEDVLLHLGPQLLAEGRLCDAVGAEHLDVRVRGLDVLEHLDTLVLGDAAEEETIGARGLDLRRKGAEVRGLGVDAVVAGDLEALLSADLLDLVGEALSVDLLVVQDVDLLDALVLHVGRLRGRLDVIGGHDTGERLRAGRLVLRRLALLGTFRTRQADVGVRRRDHQDPGLVEQRRGNCRSPRVELAEIRDRLLVADRLAGVLGDLAGLPLAGRRSGVVKRDVLNREIAGLTAGLLQGQLLPADDILGLRPRIALQRKRRVDRQRVATGLATAAAASSSSPHAATPNAMAAIRQLHTANQRTLKRPSS